MPMFTKQKEAFTRAAGPLKQTIETLTIGVVVDTNDPQQMGRVRVVCPQWGDSYRTPVEDLPWASYVSPFGGQISVGTRGSGISESDGGVSYGMWAIPKVSAQVIVMCVDGDPRLRVYMGCIFDQLTPHTMPHGRWMYDGHPGLESVGSDPTPHGPYTSREHVIEPLTTNLQQAFGGQGDPNYEWRSRASDYSVSSVDVSQLAGTYSNVQDDKNIAYEDWYSTQGYGTSRTDPHATSAFTDKNYDSTIYSWTTPGFHAFSMDDRQENCRMRLRTTSGHQILMDDTNERIYIATAKGNNWIEMDQAGNIDIFTTNKVNVRAQQDINFTSDGTVRMYGATGIHMVSGGDIRMDALQGDVHVKGTNIRGHASQNVNLQSDQDINIKSGATLNLSSATTVNVNSGTDLLLTATGSASMGATGMIIIDGAGVSLESSPAPIAGVAATAGDLAAFYTNRVPAHEPWARTMTKDDTTMSPEFAYTDKDVNRSERGKQIPRGMFWRR